MPNPLEYDEESDGMEADLFGSEPEDDQDDLIPDKRKPVKVAGPSTPLGAPVQPSSPAPQAPTRVTAEQRLEQLRRQHTSLERPPVSGVPTLKWLTMRVILMNTSRIDDIGGLTYKQMAVFLDQLPRQSLQEIEESSPHILKDTDWLWEGFLLQDYPLYHERCREKDGVPRTKGWRRKFAAALQEAEERKAKAALRITQGYAAMEKDRQDRKIKVIDSFVASPKGSRGHSLRTARVGKTAASAYAPLKKAQSAINRARTDSQRARIALTHASGKYVPPPPSRASASSSGSAYANPYAGTSHSSHITHPRHPNYIPPEQMVTGPRLPPPRVPKPVIDVPFRDARPITAEARQALPVHIKPSAPPKPERFRIDDTVPKTKTREMHKPKVDNFVPDKPKQVVNFFTRLDSSAPRKRSAPEALPRGDDKHPRTETPLSPQLASPPTTSRPPPPRKPPRPIQDVLFQKKKPRPHTGSRT